MLVSDDENALLADFGLTTTIEKAESEATTMTGIRQMNTLRFSAPEVLDFGERVLGSGDRHRSKTQETDVYAFGMLVLQVFPPCLILGIVVLTTVVS